MNRKRIVAILAFILVITMIFGLVAMVLPMIAGAATSQAEIDALQSKRDELRSRAGDIQATIDALSSQQASVIELKQALDEKNELTLMQILNVEEQIKLHEELIEQKNVELDKAQKTADEQLAKFKKRVRAMEEAGKYNYLEVLLGAHSIAEFLSLIDDISDIMRSDKALEQRYRDAVAELKAVKAELEAAQDEMKSKKAQLVELSDQLQQDINAASATIAELENSIYANSEELVRLQTEEASFQNRIDSLVAQLEAERRQQQQQTGGNTGTGDTPAPVGSGSLIWPVSCTYITSRQGPRTHPVTGEYKNHGGTDIGASYGSPIYAVDGGRVVTSQDGWNGGWGNYVMIDHGNGMMSLYAHMSSRACSANQSVSQGQVIGYVGSTGMSTGAHLHYELYVGGSRVDPETYYPGMAFTYSPSA